MDKLSIVIPVYNVEKYLPRCVESLINQTYKNLEIIFVNDCSPGNAEEIIKEYSQKDSRIKYVTYEQNRGLFRARVAGSQAATGDYIAFMDSDDYATCDFYRVLMEKANEKDSDIIIGKTIFKRIDGYNYIRNFHDECFIFDELSGKTVRDTYFSQKGLCFSWHTVWNKIYKKSLWDKCLPFYQKIKSHLIMTEDIAFSSLLFYYANSVASVNSEGYYYCENEGASTDSTKTTLKRFTKNMADIKLAFDFVNEFFDNVNAEKYIRDYFYETRKYYSRMWRDLAESTFRGSELKKAREILDDFTPGFSEKTNPDYSFFASVSTKWGNGLESIKEKIIKSRCKYVSFDIFDTLILRYVYRPDDVFLLMNKKFEELYRTNISFDILRKNAETQCRRKFGKYHPEYQDVNIDEIYDTFAEMYSIPKNIVCEMKEEEKKIEKELCHKRKAASELVDTAKAAGKKVILISDMYLDEKTIADMLEKSGYGEFDGLYLSSSVRLTKANGKLFDYVLKSLGISGADLLHIGDTWLNDIERPKALGIDTIFFPKASEVFENKINGCQTNLCAGIGQAVSGILCDNTKFKDSLGYRSMLALVSQFYFDNPYRSFNEESDFNADPYFIGYYAVGMHLCGLSQWIRESAAGYDKIYFMARDGYLPMLVYNILRKQGDPEAEYIYTSRKLLLPAMIRSREDFYDLPVEYRNHTPETILELLKFCCDKNAKAEGFSSNEPFYSEQEYLRFIKYFIDNIYDERLHRESIERLKVYFKPLGEGKNICFDMGYSGRIQTAVSDICGKGIDVLFAHRDAKRSADMARKGEYGIRTFYDFYPCVSGLLREHMLSDCSSSCIGLDENARPVFDNIDKIYQDEFVIRNIQQGAMEFARDFRNIFGKYEEYTDIKPYEVSMAFEGYLRCSKDIDRKIFGASYFEDLVYGSRDNINIYQFVKDTIMQLPNTEGLKNVVTKRDMLEAVVAGHSKVSRAWAYFVFDRQLFKMYIIAILARKPRVLKALVKIKHFIFGKPTMEEQK